MVIMKLVVVMYHTDSLPSHCLSASHINGSVGRNPKPGSEAKASVAAQQPRALRLAASGRSGGARQTDPVTE